MIGGIDKTNKEICIEFKPLGVTFPQEGFLFLRTDYIAPLERQKKALEQFNRNEIVNQDLKRFLLDPKIIFYTPLGIRLEKFYNQQLTKNQQKIVLKALNEKNIFLIQGPPGAGKTTVIKEIVFQILNASHFAKVCIISQQNIAVDNVLNGLQQQGIKSIVRIGLPRLMLPVGRVWFSLCVPIVGILQSLSSNAFPTGLTHHISKGVTLHTSYARYECMGI
ncbi:AAA domain protein [Helicobacter pylori Hp A-11]|uniref:AAA domain protein n=1 Tax=Helicobacter pylori Hp A-11 TaxID=992035 RepID=N4T9H8_HELPX|nr:AAA domain protein [Helicobacter pylori Hp A-11]